MIMLSKTMPVQTSAPTVEQSLVFPITGKTLYRQVQ